MRLTCIIFLSIATILFRSQSTKTTKYQPPMKKYDYAASWQKVQDFENQGLPESALKVVNEIYTSAKTENNASQLVKSVMYILKLTEYKEEESFIKILKRLDKETETAVFPAKPLLHSMIAEAYWRYYQTNRYVFAQRTQTKDFNNDDVATWSLEKIVEETIKHYQLSLEDEDKSKATKIDVMDDVLNEGNAMGRAYRPTLYDFLANRAVDFYMSEEPGITKPAYMFTINSADYMSDAEKFVKLDITSKDTMAYKYYGLKILQKLIRLHLNDKNPEALVDIDLKRLQFVYQNLTLSNKQDLYLEIGRASCRERV